MNVRVYQKTDPEACILFKLNEDDGMIFMVIRWGRIKITIISDYFFCCKMRRIDNYLPTEFFSVISLTGTMWNLNICKAEVLLLEYLNHSNVCIHAHGNRNPRVEISGGIAKWWRSTITRAVEGLMRRNFRDRRIEVVGLCVMQSCRSLNLRFTFRRDDNPNSCVTRAIKTEIVCTCVANLKTPLD